MFLAFHNTLSPPSYQSDSYIDAKDETLSEIVGRNTSPNDGSEDARFLVDMCLSGDLEKREFISNQTVEFLIDIALAATTSPANQNSSTANSSTPSSNNSSSSVSSASLMQDSAPSFNLTPIQLAAAKTVAHYAFPSIHFLLYFSLVS